MIAFSVTRSIYFTCHIYFFKKYFSDDSCELLTSQPKRLRHATQCWCVESIHFRNNLKAQDYSRQNLGSRNSSFVTEHLLITPANDAHVILLTSLPASGGRVDRPAITSITHACLNGSVSLLVRQVSVGSEAGKWMSHVSRARERIRLSAGDWPNVTDCLASLQLLTRFQLDSNSWSAKEPCLNRDKTVTKHVLMAWKWRI